MSLITRRPLLLGVGMLGVVLIAVVSTVLVRRSGQVEVTTAEVNGGELARLTGTEVGKWEVRTPRGRWYAVLWMERWKADASSPEIDEIAQTQVTGLVFGAPQGFVERLVGIDSTKGQPAGILIKFPNGPDHDLVVMTPGMRQRLEFDHPLFDPKGLKRWSTSTEATLVRRDPSESEWLLFQRSDGGMHSLYRSGASPLVGSNATRCLILKMLVFRLPDQTGTLIYRPVWRKDRTVIEARE